MDMQRLRDRLSTLWVNPAASGPPFDPPPPGINVPDAQLRMSRADPLLRALFPETAGSAHPVSSALLPADELARSLGAPDRVAGRWLVKADHQLPVAGSVKARGGFHEVIATAERVAVQHGLLQPGGDLAALSTPEARELFASHSIVVGSTGNLGMAIGLMSSALGFRAVVHMSRDAKQWKKDRLRAAGATVVQHPGDYLNAVARGREESARDPLSHFVDDEQSTDLFDGYAVAARELQAQLAEQGIVVDPDHPLFVYIPCGVGGAPGGITFGLKELFGPDVHCFFAEPVGAPCMVLQLASGSAESVSIAELGLDGRTEADGLAVGRASMLVAPLMRSRLAGVYTVTDEQLFGMVARAFESEGLEVEPSAAAGMAGPLVLARSYAGRRYLEREGLAEKLPDSTHVIWTTGGALVPAADMSRNIDRGRAVDADLSFAEMG
ncbi:D-serine ammonia-lyase [soil metagenome]